MENQALQDRFRRQLTNGHAITVITVSLFEIIGYIILILAKIEFLSIKNHYLWFNVVLPIIVNMLTHTVARLIVNKPEVSREKKNASIIIAALITSFVVAVVHREYMVTSCAFIFPFILSTVFNSKKLLNTCFIASTFIILTVGSAFLLDNSMTLGTAINLFILFGFLFISYICGVISINFSNQTYETIENQAEENDKLMEAVLRDQKTGLYNYSSFTAKLNEQIKYIGSNSPLCLAVIDIDDFKKINDTYGHDDGDEVLKFLGKLLKKHSNKTITSYRYGGEEFTILFSKKKLPDAVIIVEKILTEFKKHTFKFANNSFTFSAGVAEYSDGLNSETFFEIADQTLYEAKRTGKNRILTSK